MVKKELQELPATQEPSTFHLYSMNDPIPVPEIIECDADAAWALWEDSLSPQDETSDTAFASTVPAELPGYVYWDAPKSNR